MGMRGLLYVLCLVGLAAGGCPEGGTGVPTASCPACVPECTDKECGDDGCGGICWNCSPLDNTCRWEHCLFEEGPPECGNRECGMDPIWYIKLCGTCPSASNCNTAAGQCIRDPDDCSGIPHDGLCWEGWLLTCEDGKPELRNCSQGCEYDPATTDARCVPPPEPEFPCLPRCFGRECGPDRCGGTCGECRADPCDLALGSCVPLHDRCEDVTAEGACWGQTAVWCEQGRRQQEHCPSQGRLCMAPARGHRASCCPPGPEEPCGDLPSFGGCSGSFLFTCEQGVMQVTPCGTEDRQPLCGQIEDRFGCRPR